MSGSLILGGHVGEDVCLASKRSSRAVGERRASGEWESGMKERDNEVTMVPHRTRSGFLLEVSR